MGTADLRKFLLWCVLMNYALLLVWFGMFSLGGDWLYRMHGIWFSMDRETFNALHYAGIAFYKIIIIFFNLIPLLALLIVERRKRDAAK